MSSKPVPPAIDSVSFSCPYCGAHADQFWYNLYAQEIDNHGVPMRYGEMEIDLFSREDARRDNPELADRILEAARRSMSGEVFLDNPSDDSHYRVPEVINLSISRCYSCGCLSAWVHDNVVHPPTRPVAMQSNEDLPPDIVRDFNEASSILDRSPRGAAALLRLCVQKLSVHLGEPGKDLNTDIGSLVKKGLDARVQMALDVVRVIGNESVYPGTIDMRDDRATAMRLFDLVNLIAEKMITGEKHIASMYAGLPENKLKGIAERDKSKP